MNFKLIKTFSSALRSEVKFSDNLVNVIVWEQSDRIFKFIPYVYLLKILNEIKFQWPWAFKGSGKKKNMKTFFHCIFSSFGATVNIIFILLFKQPRLFFLDRGLYQMVESPIYGKTQNT